MWAPRRWRCWGPDSPAKPCPCCIAVRSRRAVHRFSVVIGESYTEGEALRAVKQRVDESRARYFSALIGLWQRAVYAADLPPAQAVEALCREFSPVLGGAPI